ncbi:group I truncated hemoglobin [Halomarina pelagica]|uniref:group I truncated hemoglobin n=1 Tax=Halomarina pelagica TaxID=2961599 RepID=UPI0020C49488|nr:group 1 truncated hemoglobin [Halomarina sp. BND7]
MNDQSMYDRIGGRDAVEAIVDEFYDRVLSDDRLRGYFEGMDMNDLRAHQVQFISAVAGGPVEYDGDDMREAHDHLNISEPHFDAVADHLDAALREHDVDDRDRRAVLEEVAALKAPVLGR